MGVINAIERFQKVANEAPTDKKDIIQATRDLAGLSTSIVSFVEHYEKKQNEKKKEETFRVKPEEIEKIFVGDEKSPIIQKETIEAKRREKQVEKLKQEGKVEDIEANNQKKQEEQEIG